jgi:AhpD family alkylhydroperoxidase
MLRPPTIEPNLASPELKDMLDRDHLGLGEIPSFLGILAKSPAAAVAYLRADKALAAGQLSERQREQISLAVAEINGARRCLQAHAVTGGNAGLSEEEIRSARRAMAPDPKAGQILRFTQSLVLQRGEISDEDLCALRKAGCTEAEVIEIVANIALNIFTNYLNMLSGTKTNFPAANGR